MQICTGSLKRWAPSCCESPCCCESPSCSESPRCCDSYAKLPWITEMTDVLRITRVLPRIQYNKTLLSLCREICFLARHIHKTFNKINNKTSTTQWNTELKTAQIQGKYLTITRCCDTHTKLLWATKMTDVLRITKVLRITRNHWSVVNYTDVLRITEVLWFSRKFSPWVTDVLRITEVLWFSRKFVMGHWCFVDCTGCAANH